MLSIAVHSWTHPRHFPEQQLSSPKSSYSSRLSRLRARGLSVWPTGRLLWWAVGSLWFIPGVIFKRGSAQSSSEPVIKSLRHDSLPFYLSLTVSLSLSLNLFPPPSFSCPWERMHPSGSNYTFIYKTHWTLQMWRAAQCYDWTHWGLEMMYGHFCPSCFSCIQTLCLKWLCTLVWRIQTK